MGAKTKELIQALSKHTAIALDTMVFIYHFEDNQRFSPLTKVVLNSIESGKTQGVTSVLTKLELLVKPIRDNNEGLAKTYSHLLDTFPNLHLVDMDSQVCDQAAILRAHLGLRTPDAIQAASAVIKGASALVTNDESFRKIPDLSVLLLSEFT